MVTAAENLSVAEEDSATEVLSVGVPTEKVEALSKVIRTRGSAVHTAYAATPDMCEAHLQEHDTHVILFHVDHAGFDLEELLRIRSEGGSDAAVILVGGDPGLLSKPGVRDWLANENDARAVSAIMREQSDLTNRRQLMLARHRLQETEHRCDALMESSKAAIAYVHEGMHVRANPVYLELFEVPDADSMEGLPLMDLVAKDARKELKRALNSTSFDAETALFLDTECQTMEGRGFTAKLEFMPATIDGEPCTQIIVRREMGANSEEIERLQKLAHRDPHTGLYHRNRFLERLGAELPKFYADDSRQYALLYISIDRFPEIRDTCGLDCAEGVLKEAAGVIESQAPDSALLARFGDYAFTALVQVASAEEATALADRLRGAIHDHAFASSEHLVTPTISVGITRSKQGRIGSAQEFVDRAYKACQTASGKGGNHTAEFDPGTHRKAKPADVDEAALELVEFAIAHDRFLVLFQPMLAISDASHDNYHVQLYLNDADDQRLPAASYVRAAQQAERLLEVDKWVLSESLPSLARPSPGDRPLHFHFSLSAATLTDPEFISWLRQELADRNIEPDRLTFVLDTDDVREQLQVARDFSTALHGLGCKVMLGGLGTSPKEDQALIRHLPDVGGARLSSELSKDMDADPERFNQLRDINERLQAAGLATVVTGVDHAGTLAQTWAIGVNYIQGEFLSPATDSLDFDFSQY